MGSSRCNLIGNQELIINKGKPELKLKDLLPQKGSVKMLIIGKTPAPVSVRVGHYYQGKQGKMFWNMLKKYNLLVVPDNNYEDDYLASHRYGITDIVKYPYEYGNEPSNDEYRQGVERIRTLNTQSHPEVLMFVYKAVLDKILKTINIEPKTDYGFNTIYDHVFGSRVFVFPMPGTPCTKDKQVAVMQELQNLMSI